MLRAKAQVLVDQVKQADENICDVTMALTAEGITEYSLSDNEDYHPIPPPSSEITPDYDEAGSSGSGSAFDGSDYDADEQAEGHSSQSDPTEVPEESGEK